MRVEPRPGRRVLIINGYAVARLGGVAYDSIRRHHDVIELDNDDGHGDDGDVDSDDGDDGDGATASGGGDGGSGKRGNVARGDRAGGAGGAASMANDDWIGLD